MSMKQRLYAKNQVPGEEDFDVIVKEFFAWEDWRRLRMINEKGKKSVDNTSTNEYEASDKSSLSPSDCSMIAECRKVVNGEAYQKLMSMPGLEEVKSEVKQQLSYCSVMKMRMEKGFNSPSRLMHMILMGNPGTGKTTVARLIAKIYCEAGLLPQEKFVEANRATLVGRYIGETERNTSEVIEKAKGGVLFIDEIYSLTSDTEHDFGHRALDTLLPVLSDTTAPLMVIGAGYPDKMKDFLAANPGLTSRFPTILKFKDYDLDTLITIARDHLHTYDFNLTPQAETKLRTLVSENMKKRDAGNARLVMTILENEVIPAMCSRIFNVETLDNFGDYQPQNLSTILPEDIPEPRHIRDGISARSIGFR